MTDTEEKSGYVPRALERLSQPDLINLREVLGRILERRCAHRDPGCVLLDELAQDQDRYLRIWEEDCASYVRYLRNPRTAPSKADDDLLRRATTCPRKEFDAYLTDFDAEMAAVRELGKMGYGDFEPVLREERVKTFDYRAKFNSEQVCVEVKNLRSPITILDVFVAELRAQHAAEPANYPFRLVLTYYSDNTVTDPQKEEIITYVRSLAGRQVPFDQDLTLVGGVDLRVNAQAGAGEAYMVRGEGPMRQGELNLPGFLNKVDSDTRTALLQFATESNCAHILVLNIDTPAGSIWSDFLNAAAARVAEISDGSIHCEFLLHGHRIAPDNL